MLEVNQINTYYGKSHILFDVSFEVNKEEIVYYLGRNGAGKTTTMRSIMGLTPPQAGSIKFRGKEVTAKAPFDIAHMGIGYVPSGYKIFRDLTVRGNLEVAAKPGVDDSSSWNIEQIYNIFPALEGLSGHKGNQLSGGELQMVAIARTLMGNPNFLLLDEPSGGLAPLLVKNLGAQLKRLKIGGMTILLAEQNVKFALEISERGYIIDNGRIIYQGTAEEVGKNEEVKSRYLAL